MIAIRMKVYLCWISWALILSLSKSLTNVWDILEAYFGCTKAFRKSCFLDYISNYLQRVNENKFCCAESVGTVVRTFVKLSWGTVHKLYIFCDPLISHLTSEQNSSHFLPIVYVAQQHSLRVNQKIIKTFILLATR